MRNSIMFVILAALFLPVHSTMFSAEPKRSNNQDDISITIVAGTNSSGTPVIERNGNFNVLITNNTTTEIRLWSENCQLGYDTMSFRVEYEDGERSQMCKHLPHPINWRNHPPTVTTIAPGGKYSWPVLPSSIWGERVWKGAPEPNTGSLVTLIAEYEIRPTKESEAFGIWTGHVTSAPVRSLVIDDSLSTPHDYIWADCPKQAQKLIEANPTWVRRTKDNCTPLHLAARFGMLQLAQFLLDNGADVNARQYNEFTPLHMAHDPAIARLLLEHKADLNAKDSSGRTPLENAASDYAHRSRQPDFDKQSDNARAIVQLLLDAGAEYDIRSACYLDDVDKVRELLISDNDLSHDTEAMRLAANFGRVEIVKLLLKNGADPEDAGYGGLTVSYFAIEHPDVLRELFDAGANPLVAVEYKGDGRGPTGSTLLYEAAWRGSVESAQLLLDKGMDINVRAANGDTPLHVACWNGHVQMVKWLLANKADAMAEDNADRTPMWEATDQVRPNHDDDNAQYLDVIRVLEQAGIETDVFAAIALDDVQRVNQLAKANPRLGEAADPDGRPAIHQAVMLDRRDIASFLLDQGSDPDVRSRAKYSGHFDGTGLLDAAFWGRLEIAKMLIEHGADVNANAADGAVPLHEAARMGHVELARLLLQNGADVNAKDNEGKTPADWIGLFSKSEEMTELLQSASKEKSPLP